MWFHVFARPNVEFSYLGHGYVCVSSIPVNGKSANMYNYATVIVQNPISPTEIHMIYSLPEPVYINLKIISDMF